MKFESLKEEDILVHSDGSKSILVSSHLTPELADVIKHPECFHCAWCERIVCHPDNTTECYGQGCDHFELYDEELE